MAVQHGLQHGLDVVLADPVRGVQHHGLVELIDRAVDLIQPPDDRGGRHRAESLIEDTGIPAGEHRHLGQPGDALLDEHIPRAQDQPRGAGPGHHLHRGDRIPTEVEERVIHPDPLDSEDLGVDPGQDLLDRIGRRAILIGVLIFRRRQRAGVQLAVDRQREHIE